MCGAKRIKYGLRIKRWSEEIRRVVERKKQFFLVLRKTRSKEDLEEHRRMKRVVKRIVREARRRVNEAQNFKENKQNFWKGVNEIRKRESLRLSSVGNSMGEGLTRENGLEVRWREYFVQLLNGNKIVRKELGGQGLEGMRE